MQVLLSLPVVASVDAVYQARLHQAGVLLTLPASRDPTCAAEDRQADGAKTSGH